MSSGWQMRGPRSPVSLHEGLRVSDGLGLCPPAAPLPPPLAHRRVRGGAERASHHFLRRPLSFPLLCWLQSGMRPALPTLTSYETDSRPHWACVLRHLPAGRAACRQETPSPGRPTPVPERPCPPHPRPILTAHSFLVGISGLLGQGWGLPLLGSHRWRPRGLCFSPLCRPRGCTGHRSGSRGAEGEGAVLPPETLDWGEAVGS